MSRRKSRSDEGEGEATWLTTYSDLVTLLLCFFVLLFAMSTIDNMKFKKLMASFRSGAASVILQENPSALVNLGEDAVTWQPPEPSAEITQTEEEKFEEINRELNEFVSQSNLEANVSVFNQQDGILIRFHDQVLFDKASAVLREDARRILANMAVLLHGYQRMVKIEGHTDNDPIRNSAYPSNWELSTARAVNVVKFFVEGVAPAHRIPPNLLQAAGYGEYRPLVENNSEGNKTKNRRIEIAILKNTSSG